MSVYQSESGRWYINFMIRGKRFHRAVPEATNKKEAEKAETVIKSELLQGRYELVDNKKSIPFIKLLEKYQEYIRVCKLGWKEEQSKIKKISAFFVNYSLDEITPFLIEQYRSCRKKTPKVNGKSLSNATINRETAILSKMFSIALKNGWVDSNPCLGVRKLREDTKMERYLQPDEEKQLFGFCTGNQEYIKPILICALNTGMRRGEILNLKWNCVDLTQGYITVTKTKSGKDRKIPMSSVLIDYFKELYNNKASDYVFLNPLTGLPYKDVKKSYLLLCEKAGIKGLRFHDLRHTAATRMVAMGVELIVVQDILGHSNITTTMRYAHPIPERKKLAVEALASYGNIKEENKVVSIAR